ncbi:hypothetical protein EV368DRAFT_86215 [Lentinula lateritia]|uniref:Uncharacterized protein n=1 Tax=Lentinula aff. lateritia TaxID=2804960 RepID=A0ACC1TUT0_9AGAR|nr:hypothetical protein F5876DRAFT_78647 [Lentinula aff. lateritia]KAJ3848795.1 hypothetical protein EV368DRAFT_86215 [Lentinula lateritia]
MHGLIRAEQSPAPPPLDASLGAIIIGSILAFCLYGAMGIQVYCYYQHNFNKDPFWIKFLVCWSTFIETIHTVFISVTLYQTVVTHFGDYSYLTVAHWPLSYSVAMSTLISAPVQTFYAFRISTLSKKVWVLCLSILASIIRVALGFTAAALSIIATELLVFQHKFLGYIVGALAVGIAVDIVNTISLILLLLKNKGMSIRSSRKTIDRLVLWTPVDLETGLLTSIANFMSIILALSIKSQGYTHYLPSAYQNTDLGDSATWVGPILFTAKLYSNALLASLNGRVSLKATISSVHTHISSFSPAYAPSSSDGTGIQFNGQSHNSGLVLRSFAHTTTSHIEATQDNERSTDVIKSDPEA